MTKKRIYNPRTSKYYSIRQKTTSRGSKGQIMGSYKQKTAGKVGRDFKSAIRRLSNN